MSYKFNTQLFHSEVPHMNSPPAENEASIKKKRARI
jgi:hypothetical protein